MAKYEVKLPQMGESVIEATITNWLKNVGDKVELDDSLVEVATDKVDSEIPSEVEGVLVEILCETDSVAKVGQTIAIIEIEGENTTSEEEKVVEEVAPEVEKLETEISEVIEKNDSQPFPTSDKFFSPLVKSIAKKEGISFEELNEIKGTGNEGRVTKDDMLNYLKNRKEPTTKVIDTKTVVDGKKTYVSSQIAKNLNVRKGE